MPSVYTAFKFLFWTAPNLGTKGDVFSKLILAIELNSTVPRKKSMHSQCANDYQLLLTTTTYRKAALQNKQMSIPNSAKMPVVAQKTIYNVRPPSKQTQTDFVNSETLRRVEKILYGPHSGAFCQIMDIFMSGYGKLNFYSDLLSVRFLYEEKVKFEKKINFSS